VRRPSARGPRPRNAPPGRAAEAQAQEQVAAAEARRQEARERAIEAARRDPDANEDEVAQRFDGEHSSDRPEATGGANEAKDRSGTR
jgi:hypothetical protein